MRSITTRHVFTNLNNIVWGKKIRHFSLIKNRECVEIKINVPWGYVAGKWWGDRTFRPILACHGVQDSSGSFDRLIPYLPPGIGVLAIDLPGHGHSSWFPQGMTYSNLDFVLVLARIAEYFKWSKVSLLGHSLGAIISYVYSTLFPDKMDYLICLDCFHSFSSSDFYTMDDKRKLITNFLKYDKLISLTDEPPSYTREQLDKVWHEGSRKSVEIKYSKYIYERNILPSKLNPDQYYFTRDPKLKTGIRFMVSKDENIEMAHRVQFPMCLIKADDNDFFTATSTTKELLDIITKQNKDFEFIQVGGTHHVHLNNPELVGPHMKNFIEKQIIKRETNRI